MSQDHSRQDIEHNKGSTSKASKDVMAELENISREISDIASGRTTFRTTTDHQPGGIITTYTEMVTNKSSGPRKR